VAKKILDLKQLSQQETFDVTMPSGDVLRLGKPKEALIIEFMAFQDKIKDLDSLEAMEKAKGMLKMQRDMVIEILNCNKDSVKVDENYLEEQSLDFYLQQALIKAYAEYIEELNSDPNS
jgi:quinol monooxygenase YgiN